MLSKTPNAIKPTKVAEKNFSKPLDLQIGLLYKVTHRKAERSANQKNSEQKFYRDSQQGMVRVVAQMQTSHGMSRVACSRLA